MKKIILITVILLNSYVSIFCQNKSDTLNIPYERGTITLVVTPEIDTLIKLKDLYPNILVVGQTLFYHLQIDSLKNISVNDLTFKVNSPNNQLIKDLFMQLFKYEVLNQECFKFDFSEIHFFKFVLPFQIKG